MSAETADGGLSTAEAQQRLSHYGPNAVADTADRPLRRLLRKFWAPVPWLLEATVLLEIVLGKYIEAAVIFALLLFNAAIGFFQESRAQSTLTALKSRLSLTSAVLRDRVWKIVPAAELVPGDVVKLSLGGCNRCRCSHIRRRCAARSIQCLKTRPCRARCSSDTILWCPMPIARYFELISVCHRTDAATYRARN